MTTYAYDSYGAPVDIVDDSPIIIGETFDSKEVQEGEKALKHVQVFRIGNYKREEEFLLFEENIHDYLKTLEKEDLLEILENFSNEALIKATDMEEVSSLWK